MAYKNSYKKGNGNGNVSWRRRAQIKQLAWPMAEWQIGHRKSSLVLSARFPVVKWRSRSVATSTYCSRRTSVKRRLGVGIGVGVCYTFVSFSSVFFKPRHEADGQNTRSMDLNPNPCPHPFPSPPKKCKFGVMTLSEGRDRYAVSPESYPSRVLSYPSLRTEWEGRNNPSRVDPYPYFACEIKSFLGVLSFHVHSRRLIIIESLLAGEVF